MAQQSGPRGEGRCDTPCAWAAELTSQCHRRGAVQLEQPARPRPRTHFAPKTNWMNDPNGLIFWKGRYHLFYQYNPHGTTPYPRVSWGHAASSDLVHWEDHPPALSPTPGSSDQDGCWSGRAVVKGAEVFLLYTGVNGSRQRPCVARALDDGLVAFQKLEENPVIHDEPLPDLVGFRDTAVRLVNGEVRQLIGAGSAALGGCLLEYRSKDLVSWDYCGVFLSARASGLPGGMWECPDFFQLDDRWFLVISLLDDGQQLGVLSVGGTLDRDRFLPDASLRLDAGTRWYAPQSFDAPDGRRIAFGWLRENEEELPEKDRSRVGVMSLPREVFSRPDGAVGMAPAAELRSLRSAALQLRGRHSPGSPLVLDASHSLEAVEVEVDADAALSVQLLDDDGDLVVGVTVDGEVIEVGTTSLPDPRPGSAASGPVRLFYDGGICEVFTATGVVRSEIFYHRPPVRTVLVQSPTASGLGGIPVNGAVKAWELAGIW
ncbi:MAG TPA: glycoside hydrolase family 32 protein [Acidimicrobiales bacterium]|nr:glycoside hydrolase family 32 protein [Acidimicrobiales bacterium]